MESKPDAAQIRAGRALLAWSQEDLAVRSGTSRRTVNAAESGHAVTPETLQALADAFAACGVVFQRYRDGVGVRLIETH
ncbi:Helix-turn-helix [Devosia lucknowensis]|uniref:Helix-turn-helix n=1 Tax=Devosia lucknowensis TaxID=1096929 RepID=A0A1Y6F153_9HYPH|nr:helix-turn-helix transcriptional regulator [Devosia lucknowensis]SMQ68608.1 Helix-turn-helix [Devosia lucknowensis]